MRVISFAAADAAPKEFNLTDIDSNKDGDVRIAIKAGAVFDGKTLTLQVQHPTNGDWYETGVTFAAITDTAVATLRPYYNYRISSSAYGGALAVSFMFF